MTEICNSQLLDYNRMCLWVHQYTCTSKICENAYSYAKEACGDWSADPHQHLEWSGLLKVHASWDHQGAAQSQSCSIQAQHEHHLWGQTHWAAVFALFTVTNKFTIFNSHCHYVHFVDFIYFCMFLHTMVGGCLKMSSFSELLVYCWEYLFCVFPLRAPRCPCPDPAAEKVLGTAVTLTTGERETALGTDSRVTLSSPLSTAKRGSRTNLVSNHCALRIIPLNWLYLWRDFTCYLFSSPNMALHFDV